MPLYEYECDVCGHRFEQIQKFSDPPVEKCPACGADGVHKLMSPPAIQFKGSGWYITDYARKDQTKAEKSETADAKESTDSRAPADAKESTKIEQPKEPKAAGAAQTPEERRQSKDAKSAKGSASETTTKTTPTQTPSKT